MLKTDNKRVGFVVNPFIENNTIRFHKHLIELRSPDKLFLLTAEHSDTAPNLKVGVIYKSKQWNLSSRLEQTQSSILKDY